MLKKFFLLSLVVIHTVITWAQKKDMVFVGSVSTGNDVSFSYKLSFSDSNGVISGYSVTDLMGPNETKTAIKGTMNLDKKIVDFREVKLLSTKSKVDKSQFCYINAHVKMIKKQKTLCLKGTFTGYDEHKAECAKGNIMLVSAEDLLAKLTKMAGKRDTAKDPVLTTDKIEEKKEEILGPNTKIAEPKNVIGLDPGKSLEIKCKTNHVKLSIWDDKINDGDIITMQHNSTVILDNYRLTGKYKDLEIDLANPDGDVLKIIAVNEGTQPLNTARIKVKCGDEVTYIDATTTINNSVRIILKRK